jgi:NifU-like protein involved in Fe-S cluster formation
MKAPARTLYTPAILGAATALAGYAWDEALPLRGEARSRRCGSALALGLDVDGAGRISRIGLRAHACAIGQAAAQVFASAAQGRSRNDIADARAALASWLAGEADAPDWPGVLLVEPALGYPARHDAIMLAWDAALAALA